MHLADTLLGCCLEAIRYRRIFLKSYRGLNLSDRDANRVYNDAVTPSLMNVQRGYQKCSKHPLTVYSLSYIIR
jgi:hypothetical protein